MKMKGLMAALLASAAVHASTTTTPVSTLTPGQYVLRNADNTAVAALAGKDRFDTLKACDDASKALNKAGKYKCDMSTAVTVTLVVSSTCADEKAPKVYLTKTKSAEDGKDYWDLPGASFTDDTYEEMAELMVHNAAWPAGYPNCWVKGRALRSEWRLNSKDEPGKAFMEHREPGMPDGDLVADEPNNHEPVAMTDAMKTAYAASEADRHVHNVCYVEDETPCPPLPEIKSECGPYWSVACGGPGIDPNI